LNNTGLFIAELNRQMFFKVKPKFKCRKKGIV
jgi:hypothetical protein